MATGASQQPGRGVVVTNLAPQVDMRDGSAEAWDAARRVADRFYEAGKPDLIRRAQARGNAEGEAVAAGGIARRGQTCVSLLHRRLVCDVQSE